jgi:hypothetical protein
VGPHRTVRAHSRSTSPRDVIVVMASQDPPSPVDAYASADTATPVGDPIASPPSYSQPPAAQYIVPAVRSGELNVLALVALIASCIGFTIPGIVMGHIALLQIKKTGESGHGLALAAVIVGYALFALTIVVIIVYVIFIFFVIGIAGSAVGNASDFG